LLSEREILINRSLAHLWLSDHTVAANDIEEVLKLRRRDGGDYTEAAALRVRAKILQETGHLAEAEDANVEADAAYAHLRSRRDPVIETLLAHDVLKRAV
jgi:hypothetical protein